MMVPSSQPQPAIVTCSVIVSSDVESGTLTNPLPWMSSPVPDRPAIQTLVGSRAVSAPSLPRVDESCATVPAPSSRRHQPIKSSSRPGGTQPTLLLKMPPLGQGSTTVSTFCPQPPASAAASSPAVVADTCLCLEGRKQ